MTIEDHHEEGFSAIPQHDSWDTFDSNLLSNKRFNHIQF